MKLYRSTTGIYVEENGGFYPVQASSWTELLCDPNLHTRVATAVDGPDRIGSGRRDPIGSD